MRINVRIEYRSEGECNMNEKKKIYTEKKLSAYKISSGIERQRVLEAGGVWLKPGSTMKVKSKYDRKRSKNDMKKELELYNS